jgi:soluble lytic murein transglycosylase-like protein
MQLVPVEMADRMVALARREAGWRSAAIILAAVLLVILAAGALLLWPVGARAQSIPAEAHQYKRDLIRAGRNVWGMDAPTATMAGQVHQESRWRAVASSPVGAVGIAQFMMPTARWIQGIYPVELAGDVLSADWGIRALARYDRHLWERLSGIDACERMAFVLSAYNGGEGWVRRRKARSDSPEVCLFKTCDINPGITPANQRENAGYPRRILLTLEPIYIAAGFGPGACAR